MKSDETLKFKPCLNSRGFEVKVWLSCLHQSRRGSVTGPVVQVKVGKSIRFFNFLFLIYFLFSFHFRERGDSRGPGGLLHTAQGEGGHQAHQPGEVPDEHGRTPGEPHVAPSLLYQ